MSICEAAVISWVLTDISGRFVDRDMFMRYFGNGIGHTNIGTSDEDNDLTPLDDAAADDDEPRSQEDSDDSDSDSDEEDLDEDNSELEEEDLGDEGDGDELAEDIGFDDF